MNDLIMTTAALCYMNKRNEACESMQTLLESVTKLMSGDGSAAASLLPAGTPVSGTLDQARLMGALPHALTAMQSGDLTALGVTLEYELLPAVGGRCQSPSDRASHVMDVWSSQFTFTGNRQVACFFGPADSSYAALIDSRMSSDSAVIVYDPNGTESILDLRETLVQYVDYYRLESMIVTCEPGYDARYADRYAAFLHEVNANRERILVNKNTLARFKDNASKNVITNLHILEKFNLVSDLTAILPQDIPVIIVSAGPSLDKNIELLKKAKGHCLIFAVDTAMKYLMQHDIMPDLGITVEPIKPMANYEDDRCFDVPHVFDCESNPEIVGRERGRVFVYNCRDYVKRLLETVGIEVPGDTASGGSVATAAFAVCYGLKTKHIILIGQDLAYLGETTHAGGVESAGINNRIEYEYVDGIDGEKVRTRADWIGYLKWFENAITVINDLGLDMTVTDATEGGALIHGSEVMTLEEAIGRYCGVSYVFEDELNKLPYLLDETKYASVKTAVADSFDELEQVKSAAGKAIYHCDRILTGRGRYKDTEGVAEARKCCEKALLYPLINNYAVSDIAEAVGALLASGSTPDHEYAEAKLAFEAIQKACDYFAGLRDLV